MGISVSIFKVTKYLAFGELKLVDGQVAAKLRITHLSMGLEISCFWLRTVNAVLYQWRRSYDVK
jgi:hypothetical protein